MSVEPDDPLGADALIADVRRIVALGPRACGSAGEARVRRVLVDDLRRAGIADARTDPLAVLALQPGNASCAAPGVEPLPARGIDGTATATATGPGRFLGGASSDEIAVAIDRDGPLTGAIAVVDNDLLFSIARPLAAHGIAGLVHVGSAPDGLIGAFTATFHPPPSGPPWAGRVLAFPGVSVAAEAGRRLIERLTGAVARSDRAAAAPPVHPDGAQAVGAAPPREPLTLTVLHGGEYVETRTANVVATIPGRTTERVVVGAHYDAQHASPGASDNATGLAGLLAIARLWSRPPAPRRTLELVAFAGEEPACWGSNHHVRSAGAGIHAMVNLDALGPPLDATRTLVATPGIAGLAREAAAGVGWDPEATVDAAGFPYADHAPFVDAGIEACWLWRWPPPHPYYHTVGDTPEHVDPVRLAEDVAAAAAVIERLVEP